MIKVSNAWKQAMSKKLRDRIYISVGIGIINQEAQSSGYVSSESLYWSNGKIFDGIENNLYYATMEQDFFKVDGSMYFAPENNQFQTIVNGEATLDILQPIRIDFPIFYGIKGITIDFGEYYPTQFTIETSEKTITYDNNSKNFTTNDVLGETNYIIITPISMIGGQQRFRIKNILFGVGLCYTNKHTKSLSMSEDINSISNELPSYSMDYSFFDVNNYFNVDDENSFIKFMETMQKISISFGVTLDDASIEWNQIATMYLKDWSSKDGVVSISATDRLTQMEDEYTLANRLYDRTAYEEAESILSDAGLEPDEYYIDEYLNDVMLHNPMPEGTHKSCLQLLANACRCIIRQDENGIIQIKANFANVIDPAEIEVTDNGVATWSKPHNVLTGTNIVYADMTKNFFGMNGTMYFLPEDESYLETSYVSEQIANEFGDFDANLIPFPYYDKTVTRNGITWTVNDDGSVTANGTATEQSVFNVDGRTSELNFTTAGKKYSLSGCPEGGSSSKYRLQLGEFADDKTTLIQGKQDYGNGVIFTSLEHSYTNITIVVASGQTVENLTFYPMLTEVAEDGSYPTEYQPYQQNPTLAITMPSAYTYFGVNIQFDGNHPEELTIHTYKDGNLIESVKFDELTQNRFLLNEFYQFDTMVFEFTKGYPNNRVLVNKISFGDLSDYTLTKTDMMSQPTGYREKAVKLVKCKIYTYTADEDGNPKEVEDNVFFTKQINEVGETKTIQNPLVSTQEHAELLCNWIGNYYYNNVSYDVDYRGEPRINATDIIHMDSDVLNNLQVEISNHSLNFNGGALSGRLELRRALKMIGV